MKCQKQQRKAAFLNFKSPVSAIPPHRQPCKSTTYKVELSLGLLVSRFVSRLLGMKGDEAPRNGIPNDLQASSASVRPTYEQVFDGRKQRVRGLWKRAGAFYARFSATDQAGRKRDVFRAIPEAQSVAAAKILLQKLQDEADGKTIPIDGRCPTFSDYSTKYLTDVSATKRDATQRKERAHVRWWNARLGALTLRQIHRAHINTAIADLLREGKSPRTVNLYIISLRGVLKRGIEEGLLKELPTSGLKPLKVASRKRELIPIATFEKVLSAAAAGGSKNGEQFGDYYRFLLFTGAREREALSVRWKDVDFTARQVTIGWDGSSKNHELRRVDFNRSHEDLLKAMKARRAPDSIWLFPSPQRGDKDIPAKTFRESLRLSCNAAGVECFGFHDARHYFVSKCVMAGVDYMTIARWVGHKDGGVLIGKVYGHIASEHAQRMAKRLAL